MKGKEFFPGDIPGGTYISPKSKIFRKKDENGEWQTYCEDLSGNGNHMRVVGKVKKHKDCLVFGGGYMEFNGSQANED